MNARYFGMRTGVWTAAALAGALFGVAAPASAAPKTVSHKVEKLGKISVDTYTWPDSQGLTRTVSLKRQGDGNKGNGGYAVRITYQTVNGKGKKKTIVATADDNSGDGGFGYFVSHEAYRVFTDNSNETIARRIFNTDDSALGRKFKVVGKSKIGPKGKSYIHTFNQTYYRYGTIAAIPKNNNGEDSIKLPLDKSKYKKYDLPVTIAWVFQVGTDFPRIDITVNMAKIPGPDRVNFDVRGPYGVLAFDNGRNSVVQKAVWGDRYHFDMLQTPATRNSTWEWDVPNAGGRYNALIANGFEMGMFEPAPFAASALAHGYSNARGQDSAIMANIGCNDNGVQVLPCDWEWPYQSLQYSLPYDNFNTPTDGKKIAWGSAAYYGAGPSLPFVYDSPNTKQAFVGWPNSKAVKYSLCLVLGQTVDGGLTKAFAGKGKKQNRCASAKS